MKGDKARDKDMKRRAPKRRKTNPPQDTVDVIEGPGFRMERRGRYIFSKTFRTKEQQEELSRVLLEQKPKIAAEIRQKAEELEEKLRQYNTYDILANLSLSNLFINPETYKEYSHEGRAAFVEYATLLCLKGKFSVGGKLLIDKRDLDQLQEIIGNIFNKAVVLEVCNQIGLNQAEGNTDFNFLSYAMRSYETIVRYPAYERHLYEVLRRLYVPFDRELTEQIGFTVADAIQVCEGIQPLLATRLHEKKKTADEETRELRDAVRGYRRTGRVPREMEEHLDYVKELGALSDRQLRAHLKSSSVAWLFFALGTTASYTIAELSDFTGIPTEKVRAFLDAMSLRFGAIEADYEVPSPTHPLRRFPFIVNEGRYFCPSPGLVDWAIQPMFEEALSTSPSWARYSRHRHDFLVSFGIDLMKKMMPKSVFRSNMTYEYSHDGETIQGESDALGFYDTVLFLIEAKGSGITEAARRGAPKSLTKYFVDVIKKAHDQNRKINEYLDRTSSPSFTASDGQVLVLDKARFPSRFMISLTLEPLGHLTPLLHAHSDLEFLSKTSFPWIVCIYDLMVIADIIDFPPMFPHFIKQRTRIASQGILEAHDELDVFGYYLKEGLYFVPKEDGGERFRMNLLSYTTDFDAYYFYLDGVRSYVPKPAKIMDAKIKDLLSAIEASGIAGAVEAVISLLDLSYKAQGEFMGLVDRVRKLNKVDSKLHDASMHGLEDGGWGLTYARGQELRSLESTLARYCERKKSELSANRWIGIGDVGTKGYKVAVIVT